MPLFAGLCSKRMRYAAAQARQRRFEGVTRQRIGIFCGTEATAQPHDRDAVNRRGQNPKHDVGFRVRRKQALINTTLNVCRHEGLHLADETEALLPVLADRWHRSIEEHQREVLGMLLAERVQAPEASSNLLDGIGNRHFRAWCEQHPETLFGEREENVVLAREVAVDGGGTVFDLFRNLSNRDVLVPLRDEEFAGRIQNRPGYCLSFPFVPFLYTQEVPYLHLFRAATACCAERCLLF